MKKSSTIEKILYWSIWVYLIITPFFLRAFFAESNPENYGKVDLYLVLMVSFPALICTAFRWLIIPKLKNKILKFIFFVWGMSLGEALTLFGLMLFPIYQDYILALSILMVAQYLPPTVLNANKAVERNA